MATVFTVKALHAWMTWGKILNMIAHNYIFHNWIINGQDWLFFHPHPASFEQPSFEKQVCQHLMRTYRQRMVTWSELPCPSLKRNEYSVKLSFFYFCQDTILMKNSLFRTQKLTNVPNCQRIPFIIMENEWIDGFSHWRVPKWEHLVPRPFCLNFSYDFRLKSDETGNKSFHCKVNHLSVTSSVATNSFLGRHLFPCTSMLS